MELIQSLSSYAQLSFFAFIVLLLFFIVELIIFIKAKSKKTIPEIPDYTQAATPLNLDKHKVVFQDKNIRSLIKMHTVIIGILLIALLLLGVFFISTMIGSSDNNQIEQEQDTSDVVVQEAVSKGIKIFDEEWTEIVGSMATDIEEGSIIYIGVETITTADIDKARIRVNESEWSIIHETMEYNPELGVFYQPYTIGNEELMLSIEAQLHSQESGWLQE